MVVERDSVFLGSSILLTVVTITFRDEKGFSETANSLHSQTLMQLHGDLVQHVVVDGDSSEVNRASFMRRRRPQDILISGEDSGIYDAMNIGVRYGEGAYFQFLNSGDIYASSTTLSTVVPELASHRPVWAVCAAQRACPSGDSVPIENLPHTVWRHALGLQVHCHQACFFSSPIIEACGGHSESYAFAGDFDLVFRAGIVSSPLELPDASVEYLGDGISALRASEIPRLLGRVRAERLGLTGFVGFLNRLYSDLGLFRYRLRRIKSLFDPWMRGIKN